MTITRAYLMAHIEQMKTQIAGYTGALQFAEELLRQMDSELSMEEFTEMVGGPGATSEITPVGARAPDSNHHGAEANHAGNQV